MWGQYQDVVQIYKNKLIYHIPGPEKLSGHLLTLYQWHDKTVLMSTGCIEGGFPFIPFFDPNQMVCVPSVQFDKYLGLFKKLKIGRYEGQQIPIF